MNWINDKVESRRIADARLHYANWLEQIRDRGV